MISINFRDSRPIYEQVKDSLRRLIVSGALSPDEKLPSVRELASQLVINPNTIQRAYRELDTRATSSPSRARAALPGRPTGRTARAGRSCWARLTTPSRSLCTSA